MHNQIEENMGRWGLIMASVAVLYGCAVPVPARVASWAIEGITYLATKKSIADHGISFVAEKDCSILRGVTQRRFCIDGTPSDTAVAAADDENEAASVNVEVAATPPTDAEVLNEFETAAGPAPDAGAPEVLPLMTPDAPRAEFGSRESAAPAAPTAAVASDHAALAKLSAAVPPRRPRRQPPAVKAPVVKASVEVGFYYVVGSFLNLDDAQSLADHHLSLTPIIIEARLDGKNHFRVVVGPFVRSRGKYLRRRLRGAGILNAWAIALNSVEWSMARSRTASPPEVASAARAQ